MITAAALELPVRRWVPDRLAVAGLFSVLLPVTMLNGSYTGSMLEVSNTLGSNAEDITMGYYAASAGMAIAYPIVPKVLGAVSSKVLLLADLTLALGFSRPGKGIAFTVPLSGISAAANRQTDGGRVRAEINVEREVPPMTENNQFELIISVVEHGMADDVMAAAKTAGLWRVRAA